MLHCVRYVTHKIVWHKTGLELDPGDFFIEGSQSQDLCGQTHDHLVNPGHTKKVKLDEIIPAGTITDSGRPALFLLKQIYFAILLS